MRSGQYDPAAPSWAGLSQSADNEPVLLGKVSGVYGVRGWVRLYSYTDPREALVGYRGLLARRGSDWQPIEWEDGRRQGKSVVAKINGVDDRDEAAAWIGTEIAIPRGQLPKAAEGSWYWTDLEGLSVVDRNGRLLGAVSHLLETGANDVLVVRDAASKNESNQELLIPFVSGKYIVDVDLSAGRIEVDWETE